MRRRNTEVSAMHGKGVKKLVSSRPTWIRALLEATSLAFCSWTFWTICFFRARLRLAAARLRSSSSRRRGSLSSSSPSSSLLLGADAFVCRHKKRSRDSWAIMTINTNWPKKSQITGEQGDYLSLTRMIVRKRMIKTMTVRKHWNRFDNSFDSGLRD